MSTYRDRFPWFEPQQHRDAQKPSLPTLTEGERRGRPLYGPRGQVIAEVGVPKPVPFGFQPDADERHEPAP